MATVKTQNGRKITANRMTGATPTQVEPLYVAVGTGAGTAAASDTTLFTEVGTGVRVTGTPSVVTVTTTQDTYQVVGTYTNGSGGAQTLTNAGTFDTNVLSSVGIDVKGDFAASAILQIGDAVLLTFKQTFL